MGRKSAAEKRREQSANTVEEYLALLPDEQQQAMHAFRALIRKTLPEAHEKIEWGLPIYELDGRLCYVKRFPTHLQIGFWKGSELPESPHLQGTAGKMRHVRLRRASDLERVGMVELLKSAAKVNRQG